MATVRKIAEIAGVSASTVSRVMNGNLSVKESARNKVLSAISRLSAAETSPKAAAGGNVGIIMPVASAQNLAAHPSLYTTVLCFIEALSEHGITNTTVLIDDNTSLKDLSALNVQGFLILGTSQTQEEILLQILAEMGRPFIFINRLMGNKHASCVNIDDELATELAMKHLLDLGHRHIAFIGGREDYINTKLRYRSYVSSLKSVGIEPDPALAFYGDYSEAAGEELAGKLLSGGVMPTAAYVASDPIAIGFIRCLEKNGIKVPEDISVVGFGDTEASAYISPPLTTISQNSSEMGRVAAITLIQMMECPVICRQQILLKTELIVRASTCPPTNRK